MSLLKFPKGFFWGAASRAIEIEGDTPEATRGETIWDGFYSSTEHRMLTTPGQGADHIARFREDTALLHKLAIPNYNFSLSWSRIFPDGTGRAHSGGISFYQRLVDELCRQNITPWITLYGNDMPAPLQDKGGWLSRDTAVYFKDFADHMVRTFSDRVQYWITLADPFHELNYGYRLARRAPLYAEKERVFIAAHNMLLAHAGAVKVIQSGGDRLQAGFGIHIKPPRYIGFVPSPIRKKVKAYMMHLFLDPVYRGRYPAVLEERIFKQNKHNMRPRDLESIARPLDFLALNHSGYAYITRDLFSDLQFNEKKPKLRKSHSDTIMTVDPESLKVTLQDIRSRYNNPPVVIHASHTLNLAAENGVRDHERTYFYRQHLAEVHQAICDGIDVRGFFAVPFLDGFECGVHGQYRSGIVHVDFSTFERIIKASGQWYSGVCQQNGFKY